MKKTRKWNNVKVIVSGETYEEYKGTLQEQIEELQNRISKAIEYIEKYITEQGETLPYYNYQKVIAILKGEDKE